MNRDVEAALDPAIQLSGSDAPFVRISKVDRKGSLRHVRPAGSVKPHRGMQISPTVGKGPGQD